MLGLCLCSRPRLVMWLLLSTVPFGSWGCRVALGTGSGGPGVWQWIRGEAEWCLQCEGFRIALINRVHGYLSPFFANSIPLRCSMRGG